MLRSADQKPTGLKLVLHGGNYTREQRAVVDFVCDMERTGLETGEDKKDEKDAVEGSLKFVSYGNADDAKVDTLKLEWRTKVACEEFAKGGGDKGGGDKDGGKGETSNWGFFTWLFVMQELPFLPRSRLGLADCCARVDCSLESRLT